MTPEQKKYIEQTYKLSPTTNVGQPTAEYNSAQDVARLRSLRDSREGFISQFAGGVKKFADNVKSAVGERVDKLGTGLMRDQNPISSGLQTVGTGAGIIGDVIFEGIKALTPETVKAPIREGIKSVVENPATQDVLTKVNEWTKQHPEAADNLNAIMDIAGMIPAWKAPEAGLGLGIKTLKAGKEAVESGIESTIKIGGRVANKVDDLAEEGISAGKKILNPPPTPVEAIKQVLQGKTKDFKAGVRALAELDTSNIKTFDDLDKTITKRIKELSDEVDIDLDVDQAKKKFAQMVVVKETKLGTKIATNPVKSALESLEELYTKIGDRVELENITQLLNKAKTEGLTNREINNLARKYGMEFKGKAFNKMGDPLTSVNAQLYENIRKDLKELARSGIKGEAAKAADKAMTSLYNTQKLIRKSVEKVNELQQKISKMGPLEKVGHAITKYGDMLSGGTIRGLIGGLLPRGAGYKVLNALDLQELLEKNLKIIQDAIKSGQGRKEIEKILEKLKI